MDAVISNTHALGFMLGGKAEFTMLSLKTGSHITYKIIKKQSNKTEEQEWVYFVQVIKAETKFAGTIFYEKDKNAFRFSRGRNGCYAVDSQEVKALLFVLNAFQSGRTDINLEVYHCGKCGVCGRKLTTPESISTGVGPECAKKIGIPHPNNERKRR